MVPPPTHRSVWALGGGLRTASALGICVLGCVYALRHPGVLVDADLRAFQAGPRFVRSQLTWFDRSGKKLSVVGNMADYGNVELSPDGAQIAVAILDDLEHPARDLWMVDAVTGHRTVFASSPADENWLIWSRDGRRVIFNSGRNGGLDLYQEAFSGSGAAEPLLVDRVAKWPIESYTSSTSRQRRAYRQRHLGTAAVRVRRSRSRTADRGTGKLGGVLSGREMDCVQLHAVQRRAMEVYVAPFPATGRKLRISKDLGGSQARWRRDGRGSIFSPDRELMAVAVEAKGSDFAAGAPQRLFSKSVFRAGNTLFDVTADGQSFLVNALVTP